MFISTYREQTHRIDKAGYGSEIWLHGVVSLVSEPSTHTSLTSSLSCHRLLLPCQSSLVSCRHLISQSLSSHRSSPPHQTVITSLLVSCCLLVGRLSPPCRLDVISSSVSRCRLVGGRFLLVGHCWLVGLSLVSGWLHCKVLSVGISVGKMCEKMMNK